ncbi:14158_t:CDS:1 [Acaulospora morrowiae]|uniref:14158_t:CDS:1 n=1 Tax=Acaulospora morrowiae TaxID=94023 RepID=A0A9N9CTP8_9GLOM|nr:14158_t:CDS:1 [Acaulospora morrowiae]
MVVASLPVLCLQNIFNHLKYNDFYSRRSLVLLNRYWCISLIPELWRNPFYFSLKTSNQVKLINTYLKCLPPNVREDLAIPCCLRLPTAFDYPYFLQEFEPDGIYKFIKNWVAANTPGNYVEDRVIVLFGALVENFIANASNIQEVVLFWDQPLNMFNFPSSKTSLSQIQRFKCFTMFNDSIQQISDIFNSAYPISQNIHTIDISIYDYKITDKSRQLFENLSQLIRHQRSLKSISIECREPDFYPLWKSIFLHTDSIREIEFCDIAFSKRFPFPLQVLGSFIHLKNLFIYDCKNLSFGPRKISPSAFQKLCSFHINHCEGFPMEFVKFVLSQSNSNLNDMRYINKEVSVEFIGLCSTYCTNLTSFRAMIKKDQIPSILNLCQQCKGLKDLSVYDSSPYPYSDKQVADEDGNEFLEELGKVLPRKLNCFRYQLNWSFSPETLESFLTNCAARELRILDLDSFKEFKDEHLEIIIKYCSGSLEYLRLCDRENVSPQCLHRARGVIEEIEFQNLA